MNVLRSKIRIPSIPDTAIARPRLQDRVLAADWDLVVLHAPGGYGKSVLAAQIAAQRSGDTAWLHAGEEDAEPSRFCRYIIAALTEVLPALPETELATSIDFHPFAFERWLDDFLLFFDELAPRRCHIVLDNFEAIAGADAPVRWLQRVMEPGCSRLSVLISTRRMPGGRFARWTGQQRALVLEEPDLAFSLEEHRATCRALALSGTDDAMDELWSRNRGWCVMPGLSTMSTAPSHGDRTSDYLEQELVGRLPESVRSYLRDASVLDVLTDSGVKGLNLDAMPFDSIVAALAHHGIPHLTTESGRSVRIHPIVRERFLSELRGSANTLQLAERAASLTCAEGRYDAAVELLHGLGLTQALLDLLVREWPGLDAQNWHHRVREWLDRLDAPWRLQPLFALTYVRTLRALGEFALLRTYVDDMSQAGLGFESWEQFPEVWAHGLIARTHLDGGGNYDAALQQWHSLALPATREQRLEAEHALGTVAMYALNLEAALQHFSAAADLLPAEPALKRVQGAHNIAVIYIELGRYHEALELYETSIARCKLENDWNYRRHCLMGVSWTLKELGRYEEALSAVRQAEQTPDAVGPLISSLRPHAARVKGESFWHLGRREEGMRLLRDAHEGFRTTDILEARATAVTIDHWCMLTGVASALSSRDDFADTAPSEGHVRMYIHAARRHARDGDLERGIADITQARALAGPMQGWLANTWFTEGWIHAQAGDASRAHDALRQGLSILESIDSASYALADPVLTAWVISESIASNTLTKRASRLIRPAIMDALVEALRILLSDPARRTDERERAFDFATHRQIRGLGDVVRESAALADATRTAYAHMLASAPLPPLHVKMFGALDVTSPCGVVRFSRKASRRTLEVLLMEHPAPVHEERLLEAVWPDADPQRSRRGLHTALSDLRSALDPLHQPGGPSYVSFDDSHYALDLPEGSTLDLSTLRDGITSILRKSGPRAAADLDALRRLLDLYRGELLADAPYFEYAMEPREAVRSLFLEGITALARARPDTSVTLLEHGLETDPFWSEGMGLLIEGLRRDGRPLAAVRRYRAFEDRLAKELGVEPDPVLQRQFDRLIRGA